MQIIPAILEKDFGGVKDKIELCQGLFDMVQIDICDGIFVPNTTWQKASNLKEIVTLPNLEIHLMVNNPQEVIAQWSLEQVKRIIFHIEATDKPLEALNLIKQMQKETGIAINPNTPLDRLKSIPLDLVDEILFLGVEPGFSGQEFQESILEKIRESKKMFPKVKIGIDGGVTPEISPELKEIGVDLLNAGSYFWKNLKDVSEELKKDKLKELCSALL
jgi:ribulose-phosphate 3-epimerase